MSGTKVRVGSSGAAKYGLTRAQCRRAEENYRAINKGKKAVPDSAYLIQKRNPLLALYFVEPKDSENISLPPVLHALGIGIPDDGQEHRTVTYRVNLVELRSYLGMQGNEAMEDVE